jgi:hypothetical protein
MRLSPVDREALTRALKMARAESDLERERFDREVAERGWQHAAETAAYHCQDAALKLRPWQTPPCWLCTDDDVAAALAMPHDQSGYRAAGELVQRLLAAGLSRYEPDPIAALEAAEAGAA